VNLLALGQLPSVEDSVDRDDATAMCEQVLDQRGADSTGSPSDDDAQAIRLSADQRPPRPLEP
jgi:hypothetical protein